MTFIQIPRIIAFLFVLMAPSSFASLVGQYTITEIVDDRVTEVPLPREFPLSIRQEDDALRVSLKIGNSFSGMLAVEEPTASGEFPAKMGPLMGTRMYVQGELQKVESAIEHVLPNTEMLRLENDETLTFQSLHGKVVCQKESAENNQ